MYQRFAVDLHWYVGYVDEKDVRHVFRRAAPPVTERQHVAVDDDVCRSDVLVHPEEAEVLEKSHVLVVRGDIWPKHDVVDDIRYHETLSIINIHHTTVHT